MKQFKRAAIVSVGTCIPDRILTNHDFERMVDTTDQWIVERTGIRKRHVVPSDGSVSNVDLGIAAAREALTKSGIAADRVDGIICATVTPDKLFPSISCSIQAALGCTNAFAFDCLAACSGFVYALAAAEGFIRSGQAENIIIVGSEVLSRATDYKDRATCILFGDGAGAAVIQGTNDPNAGILSRRLGADGTLGDILSLNAWGDDRYIMMQGREVFKHAVRMMSDYSLRVIADAGLTLTDIDYIIPHQANIRILNAVRESLGIPEQKMIVNLENYGNISSASIPLAVSEAQKDGRIKKGSTVVFACLGGGVTVAGAVVRF